MEPSLVQIPLGFLSEDETSLALSINPEISSQLTYSPHQLLREGENKNRVRIELRGPYLVQTDLTGTSIQAGLRLNYDIKFEISRNTSENETNILDPSFQRIFFIIDEKTLTFFFSDTLEFQKFLGVLEKKRITQLGFHDKFRLVRKLGSGASGAIVYEVKRVRDSKKFALKCFDKKKCFNMKDGKKSVENEIKIISQLNYKHICHYNGVYETQNTLYIVLEMLSCSLLQQLRLHGSPKESTTKIMIYQLLKGINYLSKRGIMHRDLKLDNIMIKRRKNRENHISIIDFGLAEQVNSKNLIHKKCGTPGYIAPEVLNCNFIQGKAYREGCDIFSIGVIFYNILFGKPLFLGKCVEETLRINLECKVDFNNLPKQCSSEAKDLLSKMLRKNPEERIEVYEALQHDYFRDVDKKEFIHGQTSSMLEQTQ